MKVALVYSYGIGIYIGVIMGSSLSIRTMDGAVVVPGNFNGSASAA